MGDYQDVRRGRHCISALNVHLAFVTKYRRGVLDARALEWLQGHFAKVCEQMEARLRACEGEGDHIHLLVEYPPKLAIAALVNALVAEDAACRQSILLWTPSYFAASDGAPCGAPIICRAAARLLLGLNAGFPPRAALMTERR